VDEKKTRKGGRVKLKGMKKDKPHLGNSVKKKSKKKGKKKIQNTKNEMREKGWGGAE